MHLLFICFICALSLGLLLYFFNLFGLFVLCPWAYCCILWSMILLTNAFTVYLVYLCSVLNLMLYFVIFFFYSCFYQLLFYVIFIFVLNNSFIVYLVYLCSVLWLTGLFCNFILLFTLLSSTVWCNLFNYFNNCIWYLLIFFVQCPWAYCCILSSYSFINAFINNCFMYSLWLFLRTLLLFIWFICAMSLGLLRFL